MYAINYSISATDCGIIVLENGVVVSSTGTKYGDTATFECNEGYDMEGDPTISCQDGGSWTDVIVCTIKGKNTFCNIAINICR